MALASRRAKSSSSSNSDSETNQSCLPELHESHRTITENSNAAYASAKADKERSNEEYVDESLGSKREIRRSTRLKENIKFDFSSEESENLSDSAYEEAKAPKNPKRINLLITQRSYHAARDAGITSDDSFPEINVTRSRRSERVKAKARQIIREIPEDEVSFHFREKIGCKIIATKEHFRELSENDAFRKGHKKACDACKKAADDGRKGGLVLCQGCINSYHALCLGARRSRGHLVTKVGEDDFVLQCLRCIGTAHEKDDSAPNHGLCIGCNEFGEFSKPIRHRTSLREEQRLREKNAGQDPVTVIDPDNINNIANVMLRCDACQRAWHKHHSPEMNTQTLRPQDCNESESAEHSHDHEDLEDLGNTWFCEDCIENQQAIDVIIAWRPVNIESYNSIDPSKRLQESQKEYLIKWKLRSYFQAKWMPGTWVWAIAPTTMRSAFHRNLDNKRPKMTMEEAIPEDYFQIDIVFDVQYISPSHDGTIETDLARANEVRMAFVKYKGLSYEDSLWQAPPTMADTERWNEFKVAYEDYVKKLYLTPPDQSTLKNTIAELSQKSFQMEVMKSSQPSNVTGGQLMDYQLEGLNWLLYQWKISQNAILADDMGLGKTVQLIAFFATLVLEYNCWPFLVVVPNSTCLNWRREIGKWAPSLRVVTYYGSSFSRSLVHDYELFPGQKLQSLRHSRASRKNTKECKVVRAHVVVMSYESIIDDKTRRSIMRVPWQALIVDEGQRLKSDKNLVYDCLSRLRFPYIVLLTGTPLQNNIRELFNLLHFLDAKKNAAELEAKYATLTQHKVAELHNILRPFFLRRTKAQVLTSLPPMVQIIVPVTMSTVQKKVYKSILAKNLELMKSITSRDGSAKVKERHNLNNVLLQLRKTLCHPFVYSRHIEERSYDGLIDHRNLVEASSKLQLLQIMLPKLHKRGHRVLIFSQFLDSLDIIEDFLNGLGLKYQRFDGSVGGLEKQKRIDAFNASDSPYFAFVLSTRAGGVGINLATADTVIILDPDFNPHQDLQSLSRAHRLGQTQKVLVFQMMTRFSAEEKIMRNGRQKLALDHVLIEQMDRQNKPQTDLSSVLRYGAEALFRDDDTEDIIYDSASVDQLLDRSRVEEARALDDRTAESAFSYGRIWANEKSRLEEKLTEESSSKAADSNIWDRILRDRERAHAKEVSTQAKSLGRGKRKRENVNYGLREETISCFFKSPDEKEEGMDDAYPSEDPDWTGDEDERDVKTRYRANRVTTKAQSSERTKALSRPNRPACGFNGDASGDFVSRDGLLPLHLCSACDQAHFVGLCPYTAWAWPPRLSGSDRI